MRKQLDELKDKLTEDVKTEVEGKVKALEEAIASDETEKIKGAMEELQQTTMKMGQAMYGQGGAAAGAGAAPGAEGAAPGDAKKDGDDNVVDAEFE